METGKAADELGHQDFFLPGNQHQVDQANMQGPGNETGDATSDNNASTANHELGEHKKAHEVFAKSAREALKIYNTICNHEQLTEDQRKKVRELIDKQKAALDLKLSGGKPSEGEDFDAVYKQLRKENNKLDALLEGKGELFKRFRSARESAEKTLAEMSNHITKLEDES
jgi:hypothetical protein